MIDKNNYSNEPEYDPTANPYEYGSEEYFRILNSLKEKREEYRQSKIKEKQMLDKYRYKHIQMDER